MSLLHFFISKLKIISYKKEWLNPGSSFELKINFIPDEIRHYHDSVKIQEFEKRSSILKLSAAPSCEINYPKNVDFGKVPLGAT